jgi:hypothetical protein
MSDPLSMYVRTEVREMKVTNLTTNYVLVNGKKFDAGVSMSFALMEEDMVEVEIYEGASLRGEFDITGDKTHVEVVVTPFDARVIETVMPSAYFYLGFQFAFAICCFAIVLRMIGNIGRTSPEL